MIQDGDSKAVKILWDLVKDGGRLMASVPAGKPMLYRRKGYRTYNEKKIREIFQDISSILWFAKNGREGVWNEINAKDIENIVYSEPNAIVPAEAIAFVICDKKL